MSKIHDKMQPSSIRLVGATDEDPSKTDSKAKQYFQIDLDHDVLQELITCSRRGKAPQVILGRNSVLRYGDHTHVLETREATFRQELYTDSGMAGDNDNDWDFAGLVGHVMTLRRAEQASKDMEIALEAFKHSVESITQEREANKTLITPDLPAVRGSKNTKLPKSLSSRNLQPSRTPNLDSKTTLGKNATLSPNTNTSFTAPSKDIEAAKYSLTHLLAIKPLTLDECCTKLNARKTIVSTALGLIADKEDGGHIYRLRKMRYKYLDVWKFPYPSEDRKAAIENAIHAFDAQRIDPHDKIWQGLLKPSERGKGITISKLKLNASNASTPLMKSSVLNGKNGLPKKTESKKPEKTVKSEKPVEKVPKSEKPMEKSEKLLETKKSSTTNPAPRTPLSSSKEKSTREPVSNSKHDDASRTPIPKSKSNKPSNKEKHSKEERPSSSAKALLNVPKNRSPLSSPPINASDFDHGHPGHKNHSNGPSPVKSEAQKSLKRKSEQHDDAHGHREEKKKKPKVESNAPTPKSLPVAHPPKSATKTIPKRKVDDDSSSSEDTPLALKIRKFNKGDSVRSSSHSAIARIPIGKDTPPKSKSSVNGSNVRRKDSGSSGSDNSPALSMHWRNTIELGTKFRKYYARYEKLYKEIESSAEPPSEEKKDEVMKMHKMLKDIKEKLGSGR